MIGAFVSVDYIVISAGNDRYQDYYDEVEFQVFDTTSTQAKGCQGECVLEVIEGAEACSKSTRMTYRSSLS